MRTQTGWLGLVLVIVSSMVVAQERETDRACLTPPPLSSRSEVSAERDYAGVRFRTGGVGEVEARAMREVRASYSLALTFAERFEDKDRFLAGILVEIRRPDGQDVLCAVSDGPFLFVDLPPGAYRVTATTGGGRAMQRAVNLGDAHRDVTFLWLSSGAGR